MKKKAYIKQIDEDEISKIPLSAQALYFHLLLNKTENNIVANPYEILVKIGASENDLRLLDWHEFITLV